MRTIRDYFVYGPHEFWRRQKYGCIGGIIGLPVICCLIVTLLYLVDRMQESIWWVIIPAVLLVGGLGVGLMVVIIVTSLRRGRS